MAEVILILGRSGSGKSTAGRNLDPAKTIWINSDRKALPFKGWKSKYNAESKNYIESSDANALAASLPIIPTKYPSVDTIIIDTINRFMTDKTMGDAKRTGFEKWTDLALGIYNLINVAKSLPDRINIYFLGHIEEGFTDTGIQVKKLQTSGKMLDKLTLESMATIVLFTKVEAKGNGVNNYFFETQSDGVSTAKTPMEMFETFLIPNDLALVNAAIAEYSK